MRFKAPAHVDFLRRPGTSWIGWLLLVLGVATSAGVLTWRAQYLRELAERENTVRAQEAATLREQELARRRAAPTPQSLRQDKARQVLQWPWIDVLRTVESATEAPVFLLSLTGDVAQSEVRLEAESTSFAQAVEYVRRLTEAGGFSEARLQSHEQLPDPMTGGAKVRFSVVATWRDR